MLKDKHIIVAVTGSIAAYKTATLVRLLVKAGCTVQVLMTEAAKAFISPLTLSTLSRRPVYSQIFDEEQWNSHVELGLWADAMVVAPATANTLARCASGMADNLVVATFMSARCPVFFAPAMDLDMWTHPATLRNIKKLLDDGTHFIPVGHGELASGLIGDGRMAEPEEIIVHLDRYFLDVADFASKRVLVTAGPTHEAIDPVRFIGNPSTGKMGIATAEAFARRGAHVTLILGPVTTGVPQGIEVVRVHTADEMYEAAMRLFPNTDISVLAAAVSDYSPVAPATSKIKKEDGNMILELKRTPDIAKELGARKKTGQIIVGFALETDDAERNAREKLMKKHFDLIVLNNLRDAGAGFGYDTNKVTFIFASGNEQAFELKSKSSIARDICDAVAGLIRG
jgi:phosphopantothenoylcysteine decarboxylase / phosphopantothenate---cysteine ligase